jgi:hypothetical protein
MDFWFVERVTRYDVHALDGCRSDGGPWTTTMSPEMSKYRGMLCIELAHTWTLRGVRLSFVADCGIVSRYRLAV